jgi:hypothetical protein
MSKNIKDNIDPNHTTSKKYTKNILNNATLLGIHKNKKFLEKLFDKEIIQIKDAINLTSVEKSLFKSQFFRILDLFEEKYKGEADLGFHYNLGTGYFIPYFRVLYPKFTITNSQGKIHEIRDLFVFHSFKWTNGFIHPYNLEGGRFSKTDLEITSGYQQSHLTSHSNWEKEPFYCSKFCVGHETDVSLMMAEFEVEMDYDRYELFLFCVDSMITWESLEGVPYIKMEVVKNADSTRVTSSQNTYENTIIKHIMNEKILLDVDFYIADGLYKIHPNLKASDFIKKIVLKCMPFDKAKTILVSKVPNTFDNYLEMKTEGHVAIDFNRLVTTEDYTIFRGRKIYAKVVKEDRRKKVPISIEDYIVYPKFLKNVLRKLESRIYEKAVVESTTKIYNSSSDAHRSVKSDTISV